MEDEIIQMFHRHIQRDEDIKRHFKNNQTNNLHEDFTDNS